MDQPVVVEAILVVQYPRAEEQNRRRKYSIAVTSTDVAEHCKAADMRAMSVGIRWVVCGGQDSFFTSDIGCQKRMIRNDTTIQNADPRAIVKGRWWGWKIPRGDLRGRDCIEHWLFGQFHFRHYRGIEKLLELGSRNTDAGDSQQVSHELIGEPLAIGPALVDQSFKLRHLLSRQCGETRVPEFNIQGVDPHPVDPFPIDANLGG
jgi:hypothetical protein